jgi:hypothetical protein
MSLPEVVARQMPQYGIELPYRFEATAHTGEELGVVFIPMQTLDKLVEESVNTTLSSVFVGLYEGQALIQSGYATIEGHAVTATAKLVEDYPHLFLSFEDAVDAEAARVRKAKKRKPRELTINLDDDLKSRFQTNNDTMTLPVLDVSVFHELGAK